ncbi:DNA protection during starvation protein 1 [Deinococcus carri]|uniref:DNA protection during starvation protein 1 n=1 Tax=Deinococcus carri TaxID=1211323 RepID=A0ABP9WB84_9DEIO
MTKATKSASKTGGTRKKKTADEQADQAMQAGAAQAQGAPELEVTNVQDEGAPGVPAEGEAKADAAHLDTVNNQLVNHGYLSEEEFQTVSETLQRNLATTISLYLKFKKYHWDIRGRFFRDLHLAYDEFIEEIFPGIDEQAERLVALGGSPIAAPADIARFSVVQVPTETVRDARTQVADLVSDLTRVGKGYRDDSQTVDDANDPATADMYNGYAQTIDKIRWMLSAMLDDDRMN